MQKKEYSIEIGGKTLTANFTDLADQTNGSVILSYGKTIVMATAVMGGERQGQDWFPLSVEFEEKFYAAGAILGSRFMRREGRPSEEAVLSARVIDRTIRPLFDQTLRRDIQIIIAVLSIDEEDPDVLGVIAASLALSTSDIPWDGPVSAVRIGQVKSNDEFIINPNYSQRTKEVEVLDLLACGNGNINMIEIGSQEVQEEHVTKALETAVEIHNKIQDWQKTIVSEIGKEKQEIPTQKATEEVVSLFESNIASKMGEYVFGEKGAYALKEEWMNLVKEKYPDDISNAGALFETKVDEFVHSEALENNKRQDGREMDEIRSLYAQAGGISDIIHGTGIFYRGGTHVFSALTLGGPEDSQLIDTIESQDTKKRYMHHYNFPPFSVGETGRVGGFNFLFFQVKKSFHIQYELFPKQWRATDQVHKQVFVAQH